MPSTVVAVSRTSAISPVARVAYQRTEELTTPPRPWCPPRARAGVRRPAVQRDHVPVVAHEPGGLAEARGASARRALPTPPRRCWPRWRRRSCRPRRTRASNGARRCRRWRGRRCGGAGDCPRRHVRTDVLELARPPPSIETTWSTASTGAEESAAMPTAQPPSGARPAAATSPPMLTRTPVRTRVGDAPRRPVGDERLGRGTEVDVRAGGHPHRSSSAVELDPPPSRGGPAVPRRARCRAGRARRSPGRTRVPRGRVPTVGSTAPSVRCATSHATVMASKSRALTLTGAPSARCRSPDLGVRPEAAAGGVDGNELVAQDLAPPCRRRPVR